jgi:hypothetical protein
VIAEEWRAVVGHPGYEVSSTGRVRSTDRSISAACRWGGMMEKQMRGRVLRPWLVGAGYLMVTMGLERSSRAYVHRLVAEAFLSHTPERPEVNHMDGNKLNNHASNLEWVTASENMRHRTHVLGCRAGQFGPGRVRHVA